jgi:hypothetical protein
VCVQVQEAACAAVSHFLGHGGECIFPYIAQLLDVFAVGFSKYQARNLLVLYEAVSTLSGTVVKATLSQSSFTLIDSPSPHSYAHAHAHAHAHPPLPLRVVSHSG